MNILILHAHYEPKSFTAAMRDQAIQTLRDARHDVVVSDLYEMNFNPVAQKGDFLSPENADYTVYSLEQRRGWESGTIAPDIRAEVDKLLKADLVIFNFPVFWFSVPAIMKGWIDRVLLSGTCFGGRNFYNEGRLRGKRALMTCTIGSREHMFGEGAVHGEFEAMFRPLLRGTFGYVGMSVLEPFVAWHVPYVDDVARRQMLARYAGRLETVWEEPPLAITPRLSDFDSRMRPLTGSELQPGSRV